MQINNQRDKNKIEKKIITVSTFQHRLDYRCSTKYSATTNIKSEDNDFI